MQPPLVSANPAKMLSRDDGGTIAYHFTPGKAMDKTTGVVFLGGFRSDMEGSKALALQQWCEDEGRAYLRFDYTGHGQSSGAFEEGCIGDWAADALYAFDQLTQGPQVLVGSSMGGWLALLVARERAERVRGLVGLAAAPDFTEDLIWAKLSDDQRAELLDKGQVLEPNDYDPSEPYVITQKLIEDGRRHLVLREPLNITVPVRLIQGMQDADVPWSTALSLQEALVSDDVEVQFVKSGDHRLSEAQDLRRLEVTLGALLNHLERS
ncbi:MAG TPA: alpha/beta hydrolase [Magnetovibrio sp.]